MLKISIFASVSYFRSSIFNFFLNTKTTHSQLFSIGEKLLKWYQNHGRDLPFRKTKNPYKIWICEIIFQQTRIEQGIRHYNRFIERFPDVYSLQKAETDEVLLYWKGLGYYSRALNLHKAAEQIVADFGGKFPERYEDIIKLKGVGKYTAAAISSISFGARLPAVDGNFYRVLSRIFADDFDISKPSAFQYFSELAFKIMPENKTGDFNQAMMDLGSEICKPKNPECGKCPVNGGCLAFSLGKTDCFPVKSKKTKAVDFFLKYRFVQHNENFLIRQRGDDFIWKKLYEFPTEIPGEFEEFLLQSKTVHHKLTHKNLIIQMDRIVINSKNIFDKFAKEKGFTITDYENSHQKSFPKPLENYLKSLFENS